MFKLSEVPICGSGKQQHLAKVFILHLMQQIIDISEDFIGSLSPQCLKALLEDHTKSTAKKYVPIFWATDNYKHLGLDYGYSQPIFPELITGKHNKVVQPRVVKNKDVQAARSKDMAEVFTPAWICNLQNNLLDAQWFGRKGVFNEEIEIDGKCSWKNSEGKIEFPEGKTWKNYVLDTRMEISCGEAPYTVSRYDATTGEFIPLENRIGFLDRKLRVVGENTERKEEWFEWAENAYKSTYGYEWQGDNLLLAREALLISLLEHFENKFPGEKIPADILENFANIISWNFWQMDGLKAIVPGSCEERWESSLDLFGYEKEIRISCEGCAQNNIHKHNGIYCKIMDWFKTDPRTKKQGKIVKFVDTLK